MIYRVGDVAKLKHSMMQKIHIIQCGTEEDSNGVTYYYWGRVFMGTKDSMYLSNSTSNLIKFYGIELCEEENNGTT